VTVTAAAASRIAVISLGICSGLNDEVSIGVHGEPSAIVGDTFTLQCICYSFRPCCFSLVEPRHWHLATLYEPVLQLSRLGCRIAIASGESTSHLRQVELLDPCSHWRGSTERAVYRLPPPWQWLQAYVM
jgi:hypothetical protein